MRRALETRGESREPPTLVVAVGKAAAGMLRGARGHFGDRAGEARWLALLPAGTEPGPIPADVTLLCGAHPHPSQESFSSTSRILAEVDRLESGDTFLFLLSGGASALLEWPAAGLTTDDLVRVHEGLVGSGLPIGSINTVRGCLSAVKAGGLGARAHLASVVTLAVSDVAGDDPATIGSGPTVAATAALAERCRRAVELLDRSGVSVPAGVDRWLRSPERSSTAAAVASTAAADFTVVASIADARLGAAADLTARGYDVTIDETYLQGSTSDAAARILQAVRSMARETAPRAFVFGGEPTVKLDASPAGPGGRNLDLAARLAVAIDGTRGIACLSGGTDGVDGTSRAAGALVDGETAANARAAGVSLAEAITRFDTERALDAAGALLITGPTGTNVGDLTIVARDASVVLA